MLDLDKKNATSEAFTLIKRASHRTNSMFGRS